MSTLAWFQGLLPEKKIFEVHIEKGHKHNAKVVLRGEAGYSEPGIQPGDVIFVLEQKPHKTFKRIQADLVIEKVCHSSTSVASAAVLLPQSCKEHVLLHLTMSSCCMVTSDSA